MYEHLEDDTERNVNIDIRKMSTRMLANKRILSPAADLEDFSQQEIKEGKSILRGSSCYSCAVPCKFSYLLMSLLFSLVFSRTQSPGAC